jgi:hypothetical protein
LPVKMVDRVINAHEVYIASTISKPVKVVVK